MHDWEFLAALPNLKLEEAIEVECLALLPPSDARVHAMAQDAQVTAIINGFQTPFKVPLAPAVLANRRDAPKSVRGDAVMAFRNMVAVPSVALGTATALSRGQSFLPLWSDAFQLHPVRPGKHGDLVIRTPALRGMDEPEEFAGQCSPLLGGQYVSSPRYDRTLVTAIAEAWKSEFLLLKSGDERNVKLFRSLQTAFMAATIPYDNLASQHDYGMRAAMWVSAIEILTHVSPGGANLGTVTNALNRYTPLSESLSARQEIRWRGNALATNALGILYKQLYQVRNAFLHGNPLTDKLLHAFQDEDRPILPQVAPLLYWAALRAHLGVCPDTKTATGMVQDRMERTPYEVALRETFNGTLKPRGRRVKEK